MNFVEINYNSQGQLDIGKVKEYSNQLFAHYNYYYSELGKDEQQWDRMLSIIHYQYNFAVEIERIVFSELLLDAINRINFVVGQYTKLTQENANKFLETLGSIGGNAEILYHFFENKIEQNREFKFATKDLINQYASFLTKNPQLNLSLRIEDSILEDNFNQAESYLNRMLNDVKSNNAGCYIATMAYGDYDHPQVLKLRYFRDYYLSKTLLGRSFIKFYYFISPKMVQVFQNKKGLNHFIRKSLDVFIKIISK